MVRISDVESVGNDSKNRRQFMRYLGVGSAAGLAGCTGSSGEEEPTDGGDGSSGDGGDSDGSSGDETDTAEDMTAKRDGTLSVVYDTKIDRLDQRNAARWDSIMTTVYDTLIAQGPRYQETNEFQPMLATDWTFDDGDLVFDLREGVKFHDGSDFNAEVVKWWFEEFMPSGANTKFYVRNIDEVVVEDTHRARVKFTTTDPAMLWLISTSRGAVPSMKAVKEHGDDYGKGTTAAGSGPFQVVDRQGDERLELERFEERTWHPEWISDLQNLPNGETPRAQKLDWRVIEESSTRNGAFEAGDADVMFSSVTQEKLDGYSDSSDVKLHQSASDVHFYMMFNLHREQNPSPFVAEDLNFRKALFHGLDKEAFIEGVFNGYADPANNLLAPLSPASDLPDEYNISYDVEQARGLMEESGWTVNPGGVSTKDGTEARFSLYTGDISVRKKAAQALTQIWKDSLGVVPDVKVLDMASYREAIQNNEAAAFVDQGSWAHPTLLYWQMHSSYDGFYKNNSTVEQFPEIDEKLDGALENPDRETMLEAFRDVHMYAMENIVPNVMLAHPHVYDATQANTHEWFAALQYLPVEGTWSEDW